MSSVTEARDRQIAATLHVTERTAENHVAHLLAKLGARSRVQIGTWVAEHDSTLLEVRGRPGRLRQRGRRPRALVAIMSGEVAAMTEGARP